MVSTVSTITTVTTITTIAAIGVAASISIAVVFMLIVFLSTKELAGTTRSLSSFQLTSQYVNVGIIPLVMAFGFIVAVKVAEIL